MFMLAWSTFLGEHRFPRGTAINLDIVLAKFPVKAQKGLSAVYAIIVAFLVACCAGAKLTYSSRFARLTAFGVQLSWTVCMPVRGADAHFRNRPICKADEGNRSKQIAKL
ncbi:MAG: hypothetical protein ACLUI3_03415 [Christensenellales bacterium]